MRWVTPYTVRRTGSTGPCQHDQVVERSSAGDPARTLALLWRHEPTTRKGPPREHTVDAVVAAATARADQHGLGALTMRGLADDLGVATMTLYTYVPGRAELLDLLLDDVYRLMPRHVTTGRPWRARLTAVAEENRALHRTHPWVGEVSTLRPPLGPGLLAKYEHELTALDGLGLTDVARDDALTYLLTFVQASCRHGVDARTAARDSAMNDAQWWEANATLLSRVLDPEAYPLASRVGTAAGQAHGSAHDPDHAYVFGLARTLDGLAAVIEVPPSRDTPRPG